MDSKEKINVAIVGLGFGAEFIPIYQQHPDANMYAICQRNEENLMRLAMPLAWKRDIRITMRC
ncbi:hypothetical protein [Sphingobacterium daejeonense]|uniref:hypothetical protein n=1 Tax=Sphingobacterium daejeonense TaxID=371142 RepID=UPI0010C39963|nr:hypothetical protein [Sphingobacterium daejeonense]VTQ08454.1 Uncharacterised protein [Sphingobacterium daejeonense]